MREVRPPAVAGSFYPADRTELNGLIDECFVSSPLGPQGLKAPLPAMKAAMVPHAGYFYSGPCAAHLYARLEPSTRRVVLLGVNHWARGYRAALSPWQRWRTPLGEVPVDRELSESLLKRIGFVKPDAAPHSEEHSIEVQLPFLQRVLSEFTILPISLAHISIDECAELACALVEAITIGSDAAINTVILASSDLSHYLSPEETEALDHAALEQVVALDAEGLMKIVAQQNISMCGVIPTAVMLLAARQAGVKRARLLKHCHSGDAKPMSKVVGYASVTLEL